MSTVLVAGHPGDTIFALASGSGRGAISVLRLSGDASSRLVVALAGVLPRARRASLRTLRNAKGAVLDKAVVLWLPGPHSYTGEDSAEFHLHGGTAVRQAVMDELLRTGARPADAGEFTRRAVLAGRMDLLEAEAIGELAAAETEAQRSLAMAALLGGAGEVIRAWSSRLTRALALEEASIDFPDDAEGALPAPGQVDDIQLLLSEIDRHLARADFGERRRQGVVIAITGAPNVGKSTLFNALVGREAAIVSAQPGTTRDVLEAALDLNGLAATLIDTAGLRDTPDPVEAEGVRRARARAAAADIVLLVRCGENIGEAAFDDRVLVVSSKSDLHPPSPGDLAVSAMTGAGLSELRRLIGQRATALTQTDADPILSNARHTSALRDTRMSLHAALGETLPELRAENLRLALQSLGRLSGRIDTEAVLDVVFANFCIGK